MKRTTALLIALIASGLGPRSLAQNPPARLTLREAEDLALKNHPQVLAAENEAAAAGQQVIVARSAYYPFLNGDITGGQGSHNARIGAGFLTTSALFNKFGQGLTLSQLVTDLGRTKNLVATSTLNAQASNQTYQATRYDVLIGVNQSYFGVLAAQGLIRVAQETVAARQLLTDQVTSLAQNNLKSQLDVSFAEVNLADAKLLLLRSQNEVQQALAELTRSLGSDQTANTYQLVEEPTPPSPPPSAGELIAQAIDNRPELASLRYASNAAHRFYEAEKDLSRPSVNLVGVAGFLPLVNQVGSTQIPSEYEGAALNVTIPVLNGHQFSARREEARYRASAADQRLREEQERIARDVRVAWATATTGFQRLDVSAQFLREAALALNLAQGRYDLGLSSIVELTQAQLNLTRAEIENLSAKYDYQTEYAALQYTIGLLR
jgi:outer membrane protein